MPRCGWRLPSSSPPWVTCRARSTVPGARHTRPWPSARIYLPVAAPALLSPPLPGGEGLRLFAPASGARPLAAGSLFMDRFRELAARRPLPTPLDPTPRPPEALRYVPRGGTVFLSRHSHCRPDQLRPSSRRHSSPGYSPAHIVRDGYKDTALTTRCTPVAAPTWAPRPGRLYRFGPRRPALGTSMGRDLLIDAHARAGRRPPPPGRPPSL